MLSPKAEDDYRALAERRLNPRHHVRKIVALSEIYWAEAVARAMDVTFRFQAFSCEYIANLLVGGMGLVSNRMMTSRWSV